MTLNVTDMSVIRDIYNYDQYTIIMSTACGGVYVVVAGIQLKYL